MSSTASSRLALADPTVVANAYRRTQHSSDSMTRRQAGRSRQARPNRPHLVPVTVPQRESRRAPLVVRINRVLKTTLIALCGVAIAGYGFDVAYTNDISRLQEQARRLSEQNSELSAQLLRAISFEGIQDSVVGRFGLRVPEHVLIVKEIAPPKMTAFRPSQHHLPIMSGY